MTVNSITTIVTHYNRPEFVHEAVASVRNQTVMPDAEILVVDDCSTPENQQKLRDLEGIATILKMSTNSGVAAARNYGAQRAKSQWLAFLDDDDLYLPDKQERQIRFLESHPEVEALGGGATMVTPGGVDEYWGERHTQQLTLAHALCYTASMSPGLIIRRDIFLELGGFNASLRNLADYEFGIRLLAAGHETHFLGEPMFVYHRGGRPQLSFQWSNFLKAELRILSMHAGLARQEFGSLGPIRLRARCCKKNGARKGRLIGRSVWAWGCALEAVFGRLHAEFET